MRERLAALGDGVQRGAARLVACGAELALAAALLVGWASLAVGVRVVVPASVRPAVWPLAIALLCFAGAGFAFVGQLAMRGLYATTRAHPGER